MTHLKHYEFTAFYCEIGLYKAFKKSLGCRDGCPHPVNALDHNQVNVITIDHSMCT